MAVLLMIPAENVLPANPLRLLRTMMTMIQEATKPIRIVTLHPCLVRMDALPPTPVENVLRVNPIRTATLHPCLVRMDALPPTPAENVLRVNPIPVPVFPAVHALAALTEAVFAIPVITAITAIV